MLLSTEKVPRAVNAESDYNPKLIPAEEKIVKPVQKDFLYTNGYPDPIVNPRYRDPVDSPAEQDTRPEQTTEINRHVESHNRDVMKQVSDERAGPDEQSTLRLSTQTAITRKLLKPKKNMKKKNSLKENQPIFRWCPEGDGSMPDVDCKSLFAGDETAIEKYKDWKASCDLTDYQIQKYSENCITLKKHFPFEYDFEFPAESRQFPLAYVLVVEKNADQVIRLLQSIYRSENLYCLTYDSHSRDDFKQSMKNIAKCYDNILMPDNHHPINWGGFSILEANMKCLQLLHGHTVKWKYVQMLSWNDYPLKTNEEMVEIFKILNGSNDSELKDGEPYRYIKYYVEDHSDSSKDTMNKPVPPGNLYIYKGSLASSLTREFINFVFRDEVAQKFYEYSKSMLIPEEQFWATLIHNQHTSVPGGFPGICKHYFWYRQKKKKPWISRYQMWKELKDPCEGQWTHKSCVFGVGDLWSLRPRPELIAHKIYADFQSATAYCLSQLQFNRTYYGRSDDDSLNLQFYRDLPAVRYQNLNDKSKFNCIG